MNYYYFMKQWVKQNIFFFILFLPLYGQGMSLEVIGKNARVLYRTVLTGDIKTQTVGKFTLEALDRAQQQGLLQFEGSEVGITSINGLTSETRVVSDTELKAFGWCYSINGVVPGRYASEVYFEKGTDRLVWFYGYILNKDGVWGSLCQPAWK